MMNEMFHEATPVILHEDDLNAMHFSIENRSPYLDRNLFEFCYRIPTRHLIQNGYTKSILRDAVRNIVPDPVLNNYRKVGFNAPILSFLDVKTKYLANSPYIKPNSISFIRFFSHSDCLRYFVGFQATYRCVAGHSIYLL